MNKLLSQNIIIIIIFAIAITFSVLTSIFVSIWEERIIGEKAPIILEFNGFSVIKKLGYDKWKDGMEYVVEKDGRRDTLEVMFYRGQFTIQPK